MKDYYSTLGVSKDANDDEVKSAFRNKAKEMQKEGLFGLQGSATQEWLDVQEAFTALKTSESRSRYNAEVQEETRAETSSHAPSGEGMRSRMRTNVVFHPDEEEVSSVMRGVFRKYMNMDLSDDTEETGGLGGEFWRLTYQMGRKSGKPFLNRDYEVRTGQNSWTNIDTSSDSRFKVAREWRDFVEQGVYKAVSMENKRYPGDWADTEFSADKIADFQNTRDWREFRQWFEGLWPQTSDVEKVAFRTFWVQEDDDFDKSTRIYRENQSSMPQPPENSRTRGTTAEGRIKFGDEVEGPRIVWGEPVDERIVWGETTRRTDPRIKFGDEINKPHIVFGDEEPRRTV